MPRLKCLAEALLLAAAFAAAGCASFPGNELAKRGYGGLASTETKVVVDYDVTWISMSPHYYTGSYRHAKQVKSVFEKSGIFAAHTLDGTGAPVHLSIKMTNNDNPGIDRITRIKALVVVLTLTLIPIYNTDEYELTVDVRSGDRGSKHYVYNDHITTWQQLFLIFALPFYNPGEVLHEMTENMLLHFLHDAQADGVLIANKFNIPEQTR